ncbi:MAG: ATP-dependent DNA helicase RecG [Candidatus Omnitrophica bacterium]|nr:ATP-dependent DNA helicase RecG [Candidatus Omnitrophota bacterium]
MGDAGTSIPDLRYIRGIGPKRALVLQKIGIRTVRDLLYLFPRRYEDRSHFVTLDRLPVATFVTCRGEVLDIRFKPVRGMPLVEVLIGDASGTLKLVFFNQPYLRKQFQAGQRVIVYGKAEPFRDQLQMANPEFEIVEDLDAETIHTGRITPIYPLTEGLFQKSLRALLKETVERHLPEHVTDLLPPELRRSLDLVALDRAVRQMHLPDSLEEQQRARRRIVFDEFFAFELRLFLRAKALRTRLKAAGIKRDPVLSDEFRRSLPFSLTPGQDQAIRDIGEDLGRTVPMNRLLQGDVGSGKTVVAGFAFFSAFRAGFQSAFLVPTEILAEQHYRTLSKFLGPLRVQVELLTKSTEPDRRDRLLALLKRGEPMVVVGTHAILQEAVRFDALGLVVTDEQHKFGVHQRNQLLQRDPRPHQLVMTATPIPRTLAMTVFADLDVSLMKDMPRGRLPVETYWITRTKQPAVFEHIAGRLKQGEQAYIVFPVIEETEKSDLLAAKQEYDRLRREVFPAFKLGLVHGKMDRAERETVMRSFARREIDVLVATSVIEVGVDQPNATLMIIENAERFGLAQLHQLRGRVGRGPVRSACFLFGEPKTEEGKMRLRLLTKLWDGFKIAEEDLKLRGQGDLWGTRQSGEPLFRVGHPVLDEELLMLARNEAQRLTGSFDPAAETKVPFWVQKYLEQIPESD